MKLGDTKTLDVESIFTGSLGLDVALGIGGLPMGRIVEIFGPESSGKTTLALRHCSSAKQEKPVHLLMQNTHLILFMQQNLV